MLTMSDAPSGGDAFDTSSNRCTRQTDRLDVLIERQRGAQFNHGDVPVAAVWQVLLMFHAFDPSELLHLRIVIYLKHYFWLTFTTKKKRQHHNIISK